jgi:hypothetical protein
MGMDQYLLIPICGLPVIGCSLGLFCSNSTTWFLLMRALCVQCGRWQGERDQVCQLCRLCLSISRVAKNTNFNEVDFEWAVDQLSVVLGTLSSRLLIGPPSGSGGSNPHTPSSGNQEGKSRASSRESPRKERRERRSVSQAKEVAGPSCPPPPPPTR